MILDIGVYRESQKPGIKLFLDRRGLAELSRSISEMASAYHCPVIAVCHFVGELYGFTPELDELIAKLCAFYKVTEIKGRL